MKKAGVTEKTFDYKHQAIIYACAFLIPFIMVQVFFALCGVYPYGPSSMLTGDMDVEFVNFFSYFINTFRSKNDFSYMLAKTLGGDFPGLAAFQLHDPLLFLLFFFPGDKVAYGIEFIFSVQISLAGLFMSVLLNKRYKASWMSLLFSTSYSFMAFFFGYFVLMIYFACIAMLPLVIYFLLEFIDGKRSAVPLVVSSALYIYINYHMGFMLVIFLTLIFISRIIADKDNVKMLGKFFLAGVTVLMTDGFFLVRTGLSLIGEKTTDTANYGFFRNFPLNQLFANLFSGSTRNQYMPLMHCSIAALFFALVYFMAKEYGIREKLANAFLLISVCLSLWINTLDAVWHGFNNPEEFYYRYAYLVSLIIIVLGYKGFLTLYMTGSVKSASTEGCMTGETDKADKTAADEAGKKGRTWVIAAFCILAIYILWLKLTGNAYMDSERQIVNVIIVLVVGASAFIALLTPASGDFGVRRRKIYRIVGFVLLVMVSIPDMLYDARTSYITLNADDGELPLMDKFKMDYRRIGEAVNYIKNRDGGFYRIEKDFERAVNDPALFDYIGLSHDSSCEKDAVNDYLMNFGFTRMPYYTFYNGGSTSFADSVLGVKYLISGKDDFYKPYEYLSNAGDFREYRNPYAIPLAYLAPDSLKDFAFEPSDNTFEKQNNLAVCWADTDAEAGAETKKIYIRADAERSLEGVSEENGHYVKTEDEGYIVYNVHITEKMPLYIYFAAPHLQSGEVFVNGESFGWYFTERQWNVLCAGVFEPGEEVEIRMQVLHEDLDISEACFYYEDAGALKDWYDRADLINKNIGEVQEITSSHLIFDVSQGTDQMVVMSIPYDKCWHIKCDGKRIEPVPAVELLLGMELTPGEHKVEMKYIPQGTVPGALISVLGLLMLGALILKDIRQKR